MSEREAMTHEMLRRIAAQLEDWNNERYGGCSDPHGDVASLRAWASELEGSTQPTRADLHGQIMDVVVETRGRWSLLQDDIESRVPMPEFDQMVADAIVAALVARGLLGVSDTPNETR